MLCSSIKEFITCKSKFSIVDLHIHGRYAISTSKNNTIENLLTWKEFKGLDIIGTGDFFHKQWQKETIPFLNTSNLVPTTEISLHFSQSGRKIAIHLVLVFSDANYGIAIGQMLSAFAPVDRLARPDIFCSPNEFCQRIKEIDENCAIIPAHIFTPYFGGLGARGMNDLSAFYNQIKVIETGISADIEMCSSVKALENYNYASFSDAHSLQTLGREATIINKGIISKEVLDPLITIECYPELGKYHNTGHRKCDYSRTIDDGTLTCPVCKGKMTRGVAERLAVLDKTNKTPKSSIKIVPLLDILRCTQETEGKTAKQEKTYHKAIETIGNEYFILLHADSNMLSKAFDDKTVETIIRLRTEKAEIKPGFDGKYGVFCFPGMK
jgi:uncharacterized protein (TIGR00375 family)